MIKKASMYIKAFTLVELMVTVGIFALMTALVLAKYGTFNKGILLTNQAYDVALLLRTAQSYGLNVKSKPGSGGTNYSSDFTPAYGVNFSFSATGAANTRIIFFADTNGNALYDSGEEISTYTLKRGTVVSLTCVGNSVANCLLLPTAEVPLSITFKRPDPDAHINNLTGYADAVIGLTSSDGGTKKIIVTSTGQISVSD